MPDEVLVESKPQLLPLTDLQAAALRAVGKQLASSKVFWGEEEDDGGLPDDTKDERTVVRCRHVHDGTYEVRVNEAVGIIALPDLQLIVEPKIPLPHFHHLMLHSSVRPRFSEDQAKGAGSTVLWDLVASWFLASVERLLRQGLLSDYQEEIDLLPAVRGSLRVQETALGFYQGSTLLACEYDEFGPDTALNRILRAALLAVAQSQFFDHDMRRRARRGLARLEEVGELRRNDLRTALDRQTVKYEVPLSLARHVLAATGRTFASGRHRAQTFLIRTPDLVEEALRQILHDGLAHIVPVKKKGLQLVGSTLRLNPDLVFGSLAVGDVKYKLTGSDWNRADLYQAVSFATGYRVRYAAVVAFSPAIGRCAPPLQVGTVSLRMITWDCSPSSMPEVSARSVLDQALAWMTDVQMAPS